MNEPRTIRFELKNNPERFDDLYSKAISNPKRKRNCSNCSSCKCPKCRAKYNGMINTQFEQMNQEQGMTQKEMLDNSSFDAVSDNSLLGAEDRFKDVYPKRIYVNPQVQDVANKMVWNKLMIDKLLKQRESGNEKQNISVVIIQRKKRMRDLKSALDNYCNLVGEDFANADAMDLECKCRKKEVNKAIKNAFDEAKGIKRREDSILFDEKLLPKPEQNNAGAVVSVTEQKTNFTGLNGIDNINDADAPPVREIFVNADGSSKINWGSFLVGGVVAIAGLILIKKYNLFKGI